VELFHQQAIKTPYQIAILSENQQLTYWSLNTRCSRLASYLQLQGIESGDFVGVYLENANLSIVSLLAIMKAGAVYVPLDPELPDARLGQIIADSQIKLLVTEKSLMDKMPDSCVLVPQTLVIDQQWSQILACKQPLQASIQQEQPAYVIYTSGSTGIPKGVIISHAAIASHCQTIHCYYQLGDNDRVLQFAPFSVDASLEQTLPALLSGSTVVTREKQLWSTREFLQKINQYRITVIDIPPAYLHELLLDLSRNSETFILTSLRLIITGGDVLLPKTVELWRNSCLHSIRLINAYGPTETTITSMVYDVLAANESANYSQSIPVGRPLAMETAYILDRFENPVATGVVGELHIGGDCLASGYLNKPELTNEKFIINPFNPDSRLYKTGDLVRWLADGNIEFMGRDDHQVKIRGFRIECGEIESVLMEQPAVQQAVVLPKTINGSIQLIAFIVPVDRNQSFEISTLKTFIQKRLPHYMMPAAFTELPALILTPTGKLDRNALLRLDSETVAVSVSAYTAPNTEIEQQLAVIWAELLGVERVGIYDNFFESGGHSLLAVRLMTSIRQTFGKELSLSTLLQNPTIATLAHSLTEATEPWSPLVEITTLGQKPPLFLVHASGGQVLCYRELAHYLGNDRPCYGFEAQGLNGTETLKTIEDMAAFYLKSLKGKQATGPYYLGGWSLGGVIAYEMARQLQKNGEQLALLVLFDSYTPEQVRVYGQESFKIQKDSGSEQETLLKGFATDFGLEANLAFYGNSLDENMIQLAEHYSNSLKLSQKELLHLFNVYQANIEAMENYIPLPYPGRINLFTTEYQRKNSLENTEVANTWSTLTQGNINIIAVPGDHYSLLKGENAKFLANEMRKIL
jgi:amino acid adenylation domain-containing protein